MMSFPETSMRPSTSRGIAGAPSQTPLRRLLRQRWFVVIRSFALFAALWQVAFMWNDNPLQLPSPMRVLASLWDLLIDGELIEHASVSTGRMLISPALVHSHPFFCIVCCALADRVYVERQPAAAAIANARACVALEFVG